MHLTNPIYRTAGDIVDPVFFAVVPDSFMKREGSGNRIETAPLPVNDERVIAERAALGPRDRWSF